VGQAAGSETVHIWRVLPLYLVVFVGFVGYSLMIAMFTPLLLRPDGGMLPHSAGLATRTIVLGVLLAVYPLAQCALSLVASSRFAALMGRGQRAR
jgi:hypothetical protein